MNLAFRSIAGHGDQTKEHALFHADDKCQLHDYMVADSTYSDDKTLSNELRHLHWFYTQELAKGDWVFLHTRPGRDHVTKHTDGSSIYHRFWGLQRAVWNDAGDEAILFRIAERKHRRVK